MSANVRTALPFIYLIVVIISQLITNMIALRRICDKLNLSMVMMTTLVPWIFIFGVLIIILQIFPGWKAPFSNTIGYLLVSSSVSSLMPKILKSRVSGLKSDVSQALEYIYDDKSLLVNQITPDNFDAFWEKMSKSGLIQQSGNLSEYKEELRKSVKFKDTVATAIWYLMTGLLITSLSYNQVVSLECEGNINKMKAGEQKHMERIAESEKRKVYVSRE